MALRVIAFIGGAFTLTLILAFIVAYLVGSAVIPWMAGGRVGVMSSSYASVVGPDMLNRTVRSFTLNSTLGVITIPIEGRVNVLTPQYVGCPDMCHWETAILVALFQHVYEGGLVDKVAFITIGVDPWSENLDVARGYQMVKAGSWIERGVYWAWAYDKLDIMEEVWREYSIYVERDNRTGLVNHFAGFLIVVDEKLKYLIVPTAEGWAKPASVASVIYDIIRREVEGMRGGSGG
ncbi:MAG: SCO family protein [Acidilobaceae archaeon]|jgi:protein SCO1/2